MTAWRTLLIVALCSLDVSARQADVEAIIRFQRAADTYAFTHRQTERRLGGDPDRDALSRGMRVARPGQEGDLISPVVGEVFRTRLDRAIRTGQCTAPAQGTDFRVPRVNESARGTATLPACLAAVLPKLPPELEFRSAGPALLLVDVHADLVIDVLHGALPLREH